MAQADAALQAAPLLDWVRLDHIMHSPLALDVLTVTAGRLANVTVPRSAEEVRALFKRGISTVIRFAERHDRELCSFAAAFGAVLPGNVHIQLYATPAGTHSYGWHYDFEDVFIAQTLGTKDYYMRDNTIAIDMKIGKKLDFSCLRQETSKMMKARLCAGDWLYIPRRWWHLVKCVEDSLSVSVGVLAPDEISS